LRGTLFVIAIILAIGLGQLSYATSGISLSPPTMVNITGKTITDFHVGQQIGVESTLTNHGNSDQKFTYLVQVMSSSGTTEYLEGFSASMLPNQSFNASQVWIPKNQGQYTIEVFVWDSLTSAIPLTDVIQTQIAVSP